MTLLNLRADFSIPKMMRSLPRFISNSWNINTVCPLQNKNIAGL